MNRPGTIVHHNDLDGRCSAAISTRAIPHGKDFKTIEMDYGRPFDRGEVEGDIVIIVDFMLDPGDMEWVRDNFYLIWIDHHKTAVNWAKAIGFEADEMILRIGDGACRLTWERFHPDVPVPKCVKLLSDYDVWKHENQEVVAFHYGMGLANQAPVSKVWDAFLGEGGNGLVDDFIWTGYKIMDYEEGKDRAYVERFAYPGEFEGLRALFCNIGMKSSRLFESVNSEQYDLYVMFVRTRNGKWLYSLRSPDGRNTDCSKIAEKFGGGGHRGAAGFESDELLC